MPNDILHNRLTVDILDRSLNKVGPGPLASCTGLTYVVRLSAAGSFSATFPARDERTDLITAKTTILDFYYDDQFEFRGIVEAVQRTIDDQGVMSLTFSGRDMAGELAEAPVGFLDLSSGGGGVTTAPGLILSATSTFKGHTWSVTNYATTLTSVYAKFAGESALAALVRVGEHIGEQWRMASDGSRSVYWLRKDTPSSGVRAIQTIGETVEAARNPNICFIQALSVRQDASGLYTRVYPYGGGNGEARVTLAASNETADTGFELSTASNYLRNTSEDNDNPIGRYVEYKQIRPVSNTNTDLQSAANALYEAAYAGLIRNDEASDTISYQLAVVGLPSTANVGETIAVQFAQDRYTIDTDLVLLAIQNTINADGAKFSRLTVSPLARTDMTTNDAIVSDMERGTVYSAHPQIDVNSYTTGYRLYVGEDQTADKAELRFWFGDEVVQIQQVLLRFNLTEMVVGAQAVSSSSTSTESGGASTPTSSGGSSHSHAVPDHQHDITIIGNGTGALTYDIGYGASGTSGGVRHNISATDHTFPTDGGSGGTTSNAESSHSHTVTIAAHTHDITAAISTEFGVIRNTGGNTFAVGDLEYRINSGGWSGLSGATSLGGGWYQLDITPAVYNATTKRPTQENNLLEIRRTTAGATGTPEYTAMLDCFLSVRNTIQAIAYS